MIKKILILLLVIGVLNANFTKNVDIVVDSISRLQWQDDKIGESMKWEEAIDYCETLKLGGYSDWRLPNLNELKSIIDKSNSKSNPAIVSEFSNVISRYYWSFSKYKYYDYYAWIVGFGNGFVNYSYNYNIFYVRCVRAGE